MMLAVFLVVTRSRLRDSSREEGGEGYKEPQVNQLFCKPICKPDAARQHGMGETEPTERDVICRVRRGHHDRERQAETAETHVVVLITQRSKKGGLNCHRKQAQIVGQSC